MKLLFFNYEYPPLGGGAGNATAYILKEYSKIPDLKVDLITSSVDCEYHLEKMGENISIHRLPIGKNKNNLHFQSQKEVLKYTWKAYFFSKKLIKKNEYNLSHSFFAFPCGFISLLLKWQNRIPYIVSLRGSDVPGYSERFVWLYFFIKPLVRIIWKKSFAVVANSQGLKELALKTNPRQEIGVIYNGVDIQTFIPRSLASGTESPEAKLRGNLKFIITTGASRITARKGIKYLLEALNKLLPEYPNLYLELMGEGDEKENLEKISKDLGLEKNVKFVGRIPRENTAPYYQEASIFVLPSLNEGMSNAMLEALASGLPILATDTGGTRELVEDGKNGFIIQTKSSDNIAEKIKRLIDNPELRQKMAKESRKKALEMSWEKVAGEYVEIYNKIKK
jgi:glycosyltransferase involved in cell wall biosynthesis